MEYKSKFFRRINKFEYLNQIYLNKILKLKKLSKINVISRGDDYQILFTAPKSKRGIIKKISGRIGVKITKIGSIQNNSLKSIIIDQNNIEITPKNKGYLHIF